MTVVLESLAFNSDNFISAGIITAESGPAIQIFLSTASSISLTISDNQPTIKPPLQRYTIRSEAPKDTLNLYISLLEQLGAPDARIPSLELLQKMYHAF